MPKHHDMDTHNHNHCLGETHKKVYSNKTRNILIISIILTFIFMLLEFIGGIISGSIALISDSVHMLSDFISLIVGLAGILVSRVGSNLNKTYGYTRFEIIVSLSNALFLLFICGLIVYEAIKRVITPTAVDSLIMLPVAIAGLLINFIVLFLISKSGSHIGHNHSHNHSHINAPRSKSLLMQGVFLHVLSDLLGSVAAISTGIIIYFTNWYYIDPILSILIVLLLLNSSFRIVKKSANILMESTPEDVNVEKLALDIKNNVKGVIEAHHLHLWMLNEEENIITLHIVVEDYADSHNILKNTKEFLLKRYNIAHSTIQLEIENNVCFD